MSANSKCLLYGRHLPGVRLIFFILLAVVEEEIAATAESVSVR